MFCSKCGKEVRDGAAFCGQCGAPVSPSFASSTPEKADAGRGPKGKGIVIAFVAMGIILLAAGAMGSVWYYFAGASQNEEKDRDLAEDPDEDDAAGDREKEASSGTMEAAGMEETGPVDYGVICSELRLNDCVAMQDREVMLSMLNVLVDSKLLTDSCTCDFNDLSQEEIKQFAWWIIDLFDFRAYGLDTMPAEGGYYIQKDSFDRFTLDFFGRQIEDWTSGDFWGCSLDEERELLLFTGADGDPWVFAGECDVRENDDFYLVSAPCFYGSNGGEENLFEYYVDALFAKNAGSRFGVTLCYAETSAELKPVSYAEVSSFLPDYRTKSYGGDKLIDGDICTPWVEGVNGRGEGETIVLHLAQPVRVYGLLIYGGYLESQYLYESNGKPTYVQVDFGDGETIESELYNMTGVWENSISGEAPDRIQLPQSVMTDQITITIISAEAGSLYEDTCIGEIIVF